MSPFDCGITGLSWSACAQTVSWSRSTSIHSSTDPICAPFPVFIPVTGSSSLFSKGRTDCNPSRSQPAGAEWRCRPKPRNKSLGYRSPRGPGASVLLTRAKLVVRVRPRTLAAWKDAPGWPQRLCAFCRCSSHFEVHRCAAFTRCPGAGFCDTIMLAGDGCGGGISGEEELADVEEVSTVTLPCESRHRGVRGSRSRAAARRSLASQKPAPAEMLSPAG